MPKKGESPYKRTMGLDVPHPFAKEIEKKKPKGKPRGNPKGRPKGATCKCCAPSITPPLNHCDAPLLRMPFIVPRSQLH